MAMMKSKLPAAFRKNIKAEKAGKPMKKAIAIVFSAKPVAGKKKK